MNDKKLHIIQAALKLFGESDYHTASVQDIVKLAGVSKGAFYLHFHSKEELLVAIFSHYMEWLRSRLNETEADSNLSPRHKLTKAIEYQCQLILDNQDFLSMQVKGIAFLNSSVKQLMIEQNLETVRWIQQRIIELYGPGFASHSLDCASCLSGMLKEYFFYYIVYGHPIHIGELSGYLIDRLDELAQGIMNKPTTPILSPQLIFETSHLAPEPETWIHKAQAVKNWIVSHAEVRPTAEAMLQSLDAVIAETGKEQPNPIIIKGMHSYLISLAKEHPPLVSLLEQLFELNPCNPCG